MKTAEKKKRSSKSADNELLSDKLITSEYRYEYIKELFRSLRTKILMGLYNTPDKSLVVTSLEAKSGKTTIASNIAISIAQQDKKTILIDGDLKRGSVHSLFEMEKAPGFSEFLRGEEMLSAESIYSLIHETHVPNLYVIPAGEYVTNSAELLTSKRFELLKQLLSQQFEVIILDTPPLGALTDAVVVHELFFRYIIIVKAGVTNVVDLKKKLREFPMLEKKILGLVLNYAILDKIRDYYKKSKYY